MLRRNTMPPIDRCPRLKMGEYNQLRCARTAGHDGDCLFAVYNPEDRPAERCQHTKAVGQVQLRCTRPLGHGGTCSYVEDR